MKARRRGSLSGRILAFFHDNPTEELTRKLIALKFDAKVDTVDNVVRDLEKEGLLDVVRVVRLKA